MNCPQCGFENPPGSAFCGKCGAALATACPRCGTPNPPGFAFCGKCGSPLTPDPDRLTTADLDRLRHYLPPSLIEALQFDLPSPSARVLEACHNRLTLLLDTTSSHLPTYLVEQVAQDPAPGKTGGQFINGTLLFADISGFTAMSERLSRIGREGAEQIRAIVNRYFGVMLSILRESHGQLIKFGGDALLGLFLDPPAGSAARAAQAALSMQAAMADFAQTRTSQGIFPLQMKVGLHRGRFFAAQLGTPAGMEFALFGADVNATAATESAATAGQVLLDRATFEAIQVPCQIVAVPGHDQYLAIERFEAPPATLRAQAAPSAGPRPVAATVASLRRVTKLLDALTPYLPAGLLARIALDTSSRALEGEHRLVSVLFTNLFGLGDIADRLGPGRETQIVAGLNHCFVTLNSAIQRFGGVVNKIDLYDHGDKLLAFFGAPVAHEDDAERAVRAALEMQTTLTELSHSLPAEVGLPDLQLRQHIGVSYGFVFAGYMGTNWRHEYTVMGDEVNLSARLMSVAETGSITVSQAIQRKVQALFDMVPRGEVKLKGKSLPVPIFLVSGPRAIPEPVRGLKGMRSPLVGRGPDWNKALAAIDQITTGRGQIVCITGEAGLGKSRLVAEMRQHIARALVATAPAAAPAPDKPDGAFGKPMAAVRWVEGRCLSYTESVPYIPFREIVRQLLGIRPDDSEAEAWNKLRQGLAENLTPDDMSATLPYLAHFLNLHLGDLDEKIRYLDAEALQRRTFVAIRSLIEAYAPAPSAPLVLFVDDIHWIDQASRALLEYLLPLVDHLPLLLALLYRPERENACWQIHERVAREFAHCATQIVLDRLTPEDSLTLLYNLVGIKDWPPEMREAILSRTEGNPLYIEEVLRVLIDDGALIQDSRGAWRLSAGIRLVKVPDTLQGVMMTRLDRMDEPARRTAQVASVVGRTIPFDVLTHVTPEDGDGLGTYLVRLQQHEIIRESQRLPELIYAFWHTLMQEVCYGSLLASIRRAYHCKIAEYLEAGRSTGRSEAENQYPLIAYHAFVGQDWPRALRYQILAGQQSQRLFANQEAIDHFTKALQSAEALPPDETREQRQIIEEALGELLTTTSQYEPAFEHLKEARTLALERGDADTQARACRWLARLHEFRGEYPPAFTWIQEGLAALKGRETAEAAELLGLAAFINTRQGNYDDAQERCQNGLRIAEALGEVSVAARAYNVLGHITRLRGGNAIEYFQKSFDLYQRAGDIYGQALALNQLANAHFNRGDWTEAERHYRQAREIFDHLGDAYHRAVADNNLGGIALNQGRLDEALAFYEGGLKSQKQIGGSLWLLGVLHMNLGDTFVRRGDIEAGRQHLRDSQAYFEQAQARDFLPEMHRHFAEAALRAGELAEAEAQGQHALSLARELSMRGEEGNSRRVLGEAATVQTRFDEAEAQLTESALILEGVGEEYELARSRLSLARLYLAQGKREAGLAALDRCTEVFQRLDAALDLDAARALRLAEST